MKIYQANANVIVGSNEDSSNFGAITGIMSYDNNRSGIKDEKTRFESLNIEAGSFSVFKDGQKAIVQVNGSDNAKTLQDKLRQAFGQDVDGSEEDNICVAYINGAMKIYQNNADITVGSNSDTSNLSTMIGYMSSNNVASSTRRFYKVNEDTKVTEVQPDNETTSPQSSVDVEKKDVEKKVGGDN